MRKLFNKLFLIAFLLFAKNAQAQITVAQNANANQLAQMLVGKGVKISNAVLTGSVGQAGKFYVKNGALPFDSGVVLSSGYVKTTGSNIGIDGAQSNFASKSFNGAGHTDLEWLLNNTGAPKTHDACVLEFDFVPDGDSINVSYIFSSEEYAQYICSQFNDVFGFILTGFGIIGRKNLALVPNNIPNNNIPVSINSINDGVPSSGNPVDFVTYCQATGIGAPYTAFYQSNAGGQHLTHFGRTKELVARAKVTRCKTYHLRLAIADYFDGIWDSGIFLKASSLISSPPATLNIAGAYRDSSKDVLVERCHPNGYVKLYRNTKLDTTTALTLNFSYGGTATYGVDYTAPTSLTFAPYKTVDSLQVNVIDDGVGDDNETIIIKMNASCAGVADSIPLKIKEFWGYTQNIDTTICYKNGSKLSSLYSDSTQTTFLWSTGATTGSIFPDSSGLYTVEALLKNSCFLKDTFKVKVDTFIVVNTVKNYSTCSLDSVALSYTSNQPTGTHLWSTGSIDSIIKVNATGNYVMNATSKNGCKSSDTSFIKYITTPVLSLPVAANFCNGDSILLTASTDLGLKYLWNTGDTLNAIWVKNSGVYSVVAQANGCIVYDTAVITSKPNPSVNLPTNISKCKGETVWLNASTFAGSIYSWSNGSNADSIAVTTTGQYIVNINLNGCFATDTSDIVFYDIPVLNLPTSINFCAGDSGLLNAATFVGTKYLWNTADTTNSITVKTNGTYSVTATLGVCSAYDTTIVSVTPYPILNLQTNISSCKGDSVLLDATNASGTTYTWNTGETTPTIWIKNTGTYFVEASINGCSAKDTAVAVFNNTPVLNLPSTKNICAGDSALLNATTFIGTQYLWNTGDTTTTITVKTDGTYFVKATLGVCNAYDTTVLSVTPYPILNLQTNISSCKGDSVLLDATSASGTIYTWNNGATTPTLWIKNTGTYIVKADINSCVSRDTAIAIFNNTPILNLPSTKNICAGDSAILNATTYFGTSYLWSTGDITSTLKVKTSGTYFVKASLGVCDAYDTTIVSVTQYQQLNLPANVSACQGDTFLLDATAAAGTIYIWSNGAITPTITINNSGTYIVNASLNGCSTRDTTEAIFNYTPILNLPATVNFCEGDSIMLNATTYAGTNYLWNIGATTPTINVKTSGVYSVKASLGVCNAEDSTKVNVTQYQILNLPPTVVGCAGDSVFLDATSAVGTLYTWSTGATTPTVWVKADGNYRVTASLNGCPTKDTSIIVFNIPPTVTVQPSFASFCDGDSVLLTATSNMTNSKFLWNTNDATNTLLVKVSGEFLVDVKANGCTTRGIANVIAYPIPTVDAGKDLYIMQGDKELIKASASNDVNSFTWTPSTGLNNASILQPEIINPIETTYKLSVSNGHCSNFDTVKIIVLGSFKIPNAFSPNGDGVNDFWEIKGMEKYKTVDVSVFDRYGKKVYETSGYANAWDGTHKGSGTPLPVGVYYYIIDAKRGIPPFIGSVTIIR